ncbi:MAG: hypothetical protein LBU83_11945 [Bacteroidales bacterium]|nr:hypothetical protein [Bacteroidales bacterium]
MRKNELIILIKEMISVDYCEASLVNAGQDYLDSMNNAENVDVAAARLVAELKECIVPIDDAIALARSHPDNEFWKGVLEAELKAKEEGMTICGCVACVNAQKILDNHEYLV